MDSFLYLGRDKDVIGFSRGHFYRLLPYASCRTLPINLPTDYATRKSAIIYI